MNTRTGKIARLPKNIREQLNRRLENGELAKSLVEWLNQLPEVQKLITEQFAGHPIRPQNISQWRHGGYLDWSRHQLLREQTRWTTEQAADLDIDVDATSISISEDIAMIMSAELAMHVHILTAMKNPKERFRQFQLLSRELSRLRRDDQRALRTKLRREQWQSTLEPEEDSGTGVPPVSPNLEPPAREIENQPEPSPNAGGARVLASRAQNETHAGEPIETVANSERTTPERQRAGALQDAPRNSEASAERTSVLDCGSPLPLSETENPTSCAASEQPPYNPPLPHPSTLNYQPSTTLPLPPNPTKSHHKIFSVPMRGRRFVCVEG